MISVYRYRLAFRTPFKTAVKTFSHREGLLFKSSEPHLFIGEAAPLSPFSNESIDECSSWVQEHSVTLESLQNAPFPSLRFAGSMMQPPDFSNPKKVKTNRLISLSNASMESEMAHLWEKGVRTFKMKIGMDLSAEGEQIRELAARFPDIKLRLDANASLTFDESLEFAQKVPTENIDYVEQPFSFDSPEHWTEFRRKTGMALFADESATDLLSLKRLASHDAVDGVVLKPHLIGRFQELLDMVTFSTAQGWKITLTTLLESFYGRQFTARLALHFSPDRAHGLATSALLLEDFGLDYIKGDDFFLQNTEQELDSFGSLERIL